MVTPTNNSIVKAFAILDLFDDQRNEVTTADVTELVGLNTITAHRFLKTLLSVGALSSPRKGIYRPGGKLIEYGERARSSRQLALQLQPFLNSLASESGEGAMATTFDGTAITCIAAAHSNNAYIYGARVGARMEAYATANGKLWLAYSGREAVESYLEANQLLPLSRATLVDGNALLAETDEIRRKGHAVNHGEREAGLSAIAMPIFAPNGAMIAGLSIFAPIAVLDRETEERFLSLLKRTNVAAQATLFPASAG
ncbi:MULTISPECIES: IclR family transcriptional regulator [Alphaproteobacteria]|uniref:Transcriptional regulator n=2 Tax=Alphaproteobacteria TaxID=28211 RepID=A0A512HJT9_9HYPH|nr:MULTISPECIES: IclR family transcriptional regulator [Alphaproteobacteria]GEO85670.1 transcriptional regulator [Ciceribacter naphthalenivorans]GLR21975.1 transcriptional regulator [Ciceribacter naphthalenivorans]GLT04831.1 transcriptional regulator [Sphingomonas psychrolutea]